MQTAKLVAACLFVASALSARASFSFTPLGFLPNATTPNSAAHAISKDGSTVVGFSVNSVFQNQAFLWTAAGGMQALPGMTDAVGVSANGAVVAGQTIDAKSGSQFAAYWTAGVTNLVGAPSGDVSATATGISDDGTSLIGFGVDKFQTSQAFTYSVNGAQFSPLGFLKAGDQACAPTAIFGSTIVGYDVNSAGSSVPVLFTSTSTTALPLPTGYTTGEAAGIANGGAVIAGSADSPSTTEIGVLWVGGTPAQSISAPSSLGTHVTCVSGDGNAVFGHVFQNGIQTPFLWTPQTGLLNLQTYLQEHGILFGSNRLFDVTGVSSDGRTLCGLFSPGFGAVTHQAFVATIDLPPTLSRITVSPIKVVGGFPATANITFGGPALVTAAVKISVSDPIAVQAPSSVSMPAGSSTASVHMTTSGVATSETVTIAATMGTLIKTTKLTITPAALRRIFVTSSVLAGSSPSADVYLYGDAPPSGAAITVSTDNNALTLGPSLTSKVVTIPAGGNQQTFTVLSHGVDAQTVVNVSATYLSVTLATAVTVNPGVLSGLTVSPATIYGGTNPVATVSLNALAGPSGVPFQVTSSVQSAVPLNKSGTIGSNRRSVGFSFPTNGVDASTNVTLTASSGALQVQRAITIQPAIPASMPATITIKGGSTGYLLVMLKGQAGPSGLSIPVLSSNLGLIRPPSTLFVKPKTSGATLAFRTSAVPVNGKAIITVGTLQCVVTVTP